MRRSLTMERVYPHPQDKVWAAITDGDTLQRWLSTEGFAPVVGHHFTLQATPGPGFDGHVRCRVVTVEAPNTLAFTWVGGPVDTVVTLTLEADGDRTRLVMEQTGFETHNAALLIPLLQLWWASSLERNTLFAATAAVGAGAVTTFSVAASAVAGALLLAAGAGVFAFGPRAAAADEPPVERPRPEDTASAEPQERPATPRPRTPPRSKIPTEPSVEPMDLEPPPERTFVVPEPPELPFVGAVAIGTSPKPKGELNYYEDGIPSTLNPLFARSMVDVRSHELVFDRLFYRQGDHVKSRLVTSYVGTETSIEVRLLDGITWHDGKPLTTADVCFTVDAILDPNVPTTLHRYRDVVAGCTADDQGATIHFSRPVRDARLELDFAVLPAHHPGLRNPEDPFGTRPVGTGPMKAKKGRRMVQFEAAPNKHRSPRIAKLNQSDGGDPLVQVRTLLNGGVHGMISVPFGLLSDVDPGQAKLLPYADHELWYLALNTSEGPLQNTEIRRAVRAAIGREELRSLTLHRAGSLRDAPFLDPVGEVRAEPDLAEVERAMRSAGAVAERGGWMLDGEPVHLRIQIPKSLPERSYGLVNDVANQLSMAGFRVHRTERADPYPQAFGDLKNQVDVWIGLHQSARPETLAQDLLHGRYGTANVLSHRNDRTDELLDAFRTAPTPTEAARAKTQLLTHLDREVPLVVLWTRDDYTAWRIPVTNVSIEPYYYFTDFDQWSL